MSKDKKSKIARKNHRTKEKFELLKDLMLNKAIYFMKSGEEPEKIQLIKKILPKYMPKIVQGSEEGDPISITIKTAIEE